LGPLESYVCSKIARYTIPRRHDDDDDDDDDDVVVDDDDDVCSQAPGGLCALRFSAAAFLFARALRLPSRNCWAAPGLLEEELEEEEESSSSLELSFQQEIVVV